METEFMPVDETPPEHRSGFVAVAGRPNVGKSTLINAWLGQKISIVSPKPQTTRNRLLGILTRPDVQVIFVDTPGVHQPKHKLGEAMVDAASAAVSDADLVLLVVDVSQPPADEDRQVAAMLKSLPADLPIVLVLNKADRLREEQRATKAAAYRDIVPGAEKILISALTGDGLEELLDIVVSRLPFGPRYYPEEQVTDQQERFVAAELVREQVLHNLRDEVPHAVAVVVQEFKERSADMTFISAVVYVERSSQKVILLGKDGQMLKRIGQSARLEIEEMLGTRVFLELWVKVRPNWRRNVAELRRMGYTPPGNKRQ